MSRYAQKTTVSPEKSRAEIEDVLRRYGADQFGYLWDNNEATIAFRANGRNVRFVLQFPDRKEFSDQRGNNSERAWGQAIRQRWRALCLVIKAKLESVQSGIESFEEAFLSQTILPGRAETVSQELLPRIEEAYKAGKSPPLLPYREQEG